MFEHRKDAIDWLKNIQGCVLGKQQSTEMQTMQTGNEYCQKKYNCDRKLNKDISKMRSSTLLGI